MKNMRKMTAVAASVAAFAMLLAGCGSTGNGNGSNGAATATEEPAAGFDSSYTGALPMPKTDQRYDNHLDRDKVKDGGTLTLPISEITSNWNYLSTDGNTGYMSELWGWYQPQLLMTDEVGGDPIKVNPDYLTDMKLVSSDPMVVQYDINPKAKWNDGKDIDWTAFEATWKALNGKDANYNPPSTDGFDRIASVKQGDNAKQVIVTYSEPYYPWQLVFSSLVNPEAGDAKTFTQGWVKNPHNEWAAGPYKVDSFNDNSVTFVPNPNWWGDKAKLDKVVYKVMSSTAEINAFQNGEIDASTSISTKDNLKAVRSVKNAQLRYGYSTKTRVLEYNGKSKPLDDLQVRKALTQAFDADTYNKIQFQGMDWDAKRPGSEMLLPFQKGYEDNMPAESKFSTDNAKKTLEADGYTMGDDGYYAKDGKTLEVSFTFFGDDATQQALANAYQAMMKKAGIKVKVVNVAESKFSDTVMNGDYQVLPMAWQSTAALGFVTSAPQLYTSDGPSNFTYVSSDEVDKLVKAAGAHEKYDDQAAAVNKAEKAALKLYGTVPVSNPGAYVAVKKGLANYGPSGFAGNLPQNIGWEK
ncbi:ABC transporter family substrate-binding protein [Bifidobacterium sp. SO1]|uniref:ABC transporter family substrate-binding protein n=1 Tax=Bifidobacterium sp. SO1 TaxID=2809029 RepID=UPI001BDCA4CA|nr:ABC transporter family substrate-binding protein [Bifidobacterium sp. SO1]MBT1160609.1 ABC transporter family substrate-binding protein [Bifidobacterium sp. SO1]